MADNEGENEGEEVTAKQKKNRKKKEAAKRKKQAQKEKVYTEFCKRFIYATYSSKYIILRSFQTAETSELPDGMREAQAGQKVEPNNVRSFVQEISEVKKDISCHSVLLPIFCFCVSCVGMSDFML